MPKTRAQMEAEGNKYLGPTEFAAANKAGQRTIREGNNYYLAPGLAPLGDSSPAIGKEQATETVGELGNLRIALRSALNEAGKNRQAFQYGAVAGVAGGVPGTVGSVVQMIKGNIQPTVEQTFTDVIEGYKVASEAKQKELDRINALRAEYGSLVPANITDLQTALTLIAPAVDKERALEFQEKSASLTSAQAEDNDIQSWAESYARGEVSIGNVPAKIRTAVKVAADKIKGQLETQAKQEYLDRVDFRIGQKTSNFETERALVLQDENLSVAEQRQVLDHIDSLEAAAQQATKPFTPPNAQQVAGAKKAVPWLEPLVGKAYGIK